MATAPAKVHTIRPPKRRKGQTGSSRKKPHVQQPAQTPRGSNGKWPYSYKQFKVRKEIIEDWMTGEFSMQQLSIKHDKDITTIKNIVEGPECRQALEVTGRVIGSQIAEDFAHLVVPRLCSEVKNKKSKVGAMIAWDAAERLGGVPAKITKSQVQKTDRDVEQSAVKKLIAGEGEDRINRMSLALTTLAMQGRRAYGLQLPNLEELNAHVISKEDGPAHPIKEEEIAEIEMAMAQHREADE